jgi:hypothetical protein
MESGYVRPWVGVIAFVNNFFSHRQGFSNERGIIDQNDGLAAKCAVRNSPIAGSFDKLRDEVAKSVFEHNIGDGAEEEVSPEFGNPREFIPCDPGCD